MDSYINVDLFTANENSTVFDNQPVLVISRFSENLDWLNDNASSFLNIIYNKGNDEDYQKNSNTIRTVNAPNLGRCDGTYVRFIVENYDNLPEVIIFLPGSANMDSKIWKLKEVLEQVKQNELNGIRKNVFVCPYYSEDIYDFQLNEWKASDLKNMEKNNETALTPAIVRPYGKWCEHVFGEFSDKNKINSAMGGIFAVCKKNVLRRPKEFYEDLLKQLEVSSNPEVGHYCERAWPTIFYE
jgi:hypothetical protein